MTDRFSLIGAPATAQDEVGSMFAFVWISTIASLTLVVSVLLEARTGWIALCTAFTAIPLLWLLIPLRYDDYYQRLASTGARWATGFVGVWLLAQSVLADTIAWFSDATLGAAACALIFNLGFHFARWKGTNE